MRLIMMIGVLVSFCGSAWAQCGPTQLSCSNCLVGSCNSPFNFLAYLQLTRLSCTQGANCPDTGGCIAENFWVEGTSDGNYTVYYDSLCCYV
jgi:hypothetical protein